MPAPTDFDSDDDVDSDEGHYGTPYCGRDASDASDTSPIDLFSKEMIYSCMSDPVVKTWGETTPTTPMTPTTALFPGYIPWVSPVGSPPSIVIPWNRGFRDVGVSSTLAQVVAEAHEACVEATEASRDKEICASIRGLHLYEEE